MSVYTKFRSIIIEIPILKSTWNFTSYYVKRHRKSEKHPMLSVDSYCSKHPELFTTLLNESKTYAYNICRGKLIKTTCTFTVPAVKQFYLEGPTLIGGSVVVIDKDGTAIYNHCSGENIDHTDMALMTWREHTLLRKRQSIHYNSKCNSPIEQGIAMTHTYFINYFHFVLEILPKFMAIEKGNIPADVPLIFDEGVRNVPQFMQLIEIFNTQKRKLLFVRNQEWVQCRKLWLHTPVQVFPLNCIDYKKAKSGSLYSRESLDFVRKRVISYFGIDDKPKSDTALSFKNALNYQYS